MDRAIEAFATVSLDFLRLQARFMKTGHYAAETSEQLVADLYQDESKMNGYYLDGLAMTYALWPNHCRMLAFFAKEFLPGLESGSRILEVGLGHGLLTTILFDRVPDITYVGVDISQSALDYASRALDAAGVEQGRAHLVLANAVGTDLEQFARGHGFGAIVCCEVIEHVDAPDRLMANLALSASPGARAFVSTVANMEAEDHVYLFENVDAIRALIEGSGWAVADQLANVLPGAEEWNPLPVNYSAILTRPG